MQKFNFKLQRLLDYKEILLNEEISKIQHLNQQIEDCKSNINNISDRMNTLGNSIEVQGKKVISVEVLTSYKRYINDLNGLKKNIIKQQSNFEGILEKTRVKAISLQKEQKTIQSLKEKKFDEYKLDAQYKEQAELDDLACNKRIM